MILPVELLSICDIDPRWYSGPFSNLKIMLPKQKGKRFEDITKYILGKKSACQPIKSISSEHDFIWQNKKIELKGSMITKDTDDKYSFLQIRPDQDYDTLVLMCLSFYGSIVYYRLSKEEVKKNIDSGVFKKQHGGNKADSRTYCYNGNMKYFSEYFWFSETVEVLQEYK